MNKYWKKLCTPEQNERQFGALKMLAAGLTFLFIIWFLGGNFLHKNQTTKIKLPLREQYLQSSF